MTTPSQPAADQRTRLALGCSALARAGQQLSLVHSLAQARAALRQVSEQLCADKNLSGLVSTDEIAKRCRDTAEIADETQSLAACRQLAASLARQASTLAAEVQQRATGQPRPVPQAPAPAPVQPLAPAAAPPAPVPAPRPEPPRPITPAAPAPAAKPAPPARPRVDPALVQRISIARSEPERLAVASAIESGKRFASVGNGTFIDTRSNSLWTARLTPAMKHAQALQFALEARDAGYEDWRLPTPDELHVLLTDGGLQALRSLGTLPAAGAPSGAVRLWSGPIRLRFFGFFKDAAAANAATGELSYVSLGSANVQALLVRS